MSDYKDVTDKSVARTLPVRGSLTSEELTRLTQQIWADLGKDASTRARVAETGIDIDLLDFDAPCPITAKPSAAGIDPFTAGILVSFGTSLAAGTLIELFKSYIAPHIREKRGPDSIAP